VFLVTINPTSLIFFLIENAIALLGSSAVTCIEVLLFLSLQRDEETMVHDGARYATRTASGKEVMRIH